MLKYLRSRFKRRPSVHLPKHPKIAFHINQLNVRGTSVSTYNYAHYNETLLKNKSIIVVPDKQHESNVKQHFEKRFTVQYYNSISDLNNILKQNSCHALYCQKAGFYDEIIADIPTFVHAVFMYNQPHGEIYAYISEWLAHKYNKPFVPYILDLPATKSNLRQQLGISKDAIVFGRHGGHPSFDINFVHKTIKRIADENPKIYFLFMNTKPFFEHSNIIYLDPTTSLQKKSAFINTCDAMIHARKRGETFGLAVGEFAIKNKPVLTYAKSKERAHIYMLNNQGILYNNAKTLHNQITNFQKHSIRGTKYEDFGPTEVMKQFNQTFLKH